MPKVRYWIFFRRCGSNCRVSHKQPLWSWEPSLCSFCLLPWFSSWSCCPASTAAAVGNLNTRAQESSLYSPSEKKTEGKNPPTNTTFTFLSALHGITHMIKGI